MGQVGRRISRGGIATGALLGLFAWALPACGEEQAPPAVHRGTGVVADGSAPNPAVLPRSTPGGDAGPTGEAGPSSQAHTDGGAAAASTAPDPKQLRAFLGDLGLTGDPATPRGLAATRPQDDPLVRLGQVLFFSQTLSAGFDSACGTCHHPDLGGGDGLSLPVGVVPTDRHALGLDRSVDATRDLDPAADGGPNMHRNSQTVFNAALHDRAMLHDGRVFSMEDAVVPGGVGQRIRTPEQGVGGGQVADFGVLETMTPFPMTNDNEMRGFLYTDLSTPEAYRAHLIARLRGEVDVEHLAPGAPGRWLAMFRRAFQRPQGNANTLVTLDNVQRALAAYIASQVFVDTPFKRFLEGEDDALDEEAVRGAYLFYEPVEDGGLGCASCHGGDRFTDEGFANVGFPQIGRGFQRSDKRDLGRWNVTRAAEDLSAFRVPSLLNVELTAPYGHAGTFDTLKATLRYHADPASQVADFDFDLAHLPQFDALDVRYPHAEPHTLEALARPSFAEAEAKLPGRALTDDEVGQLAAFLRALTDDCARDASCRAAWTPDASLDPDGHLLVAGGSSPAPQVVAQGPQDYPAFIDLDMRPLEARDTFPDVLGCADGLASAENGGARRFAHRTGDAAFGLTAPHGYNQRSWYHGLMDIALGAGGVTATYLDEDCWPDLAFVGGDLSGLVFYRNLGGQQGFAPYDPFDDAVRREIGASRTGVAVADLDGNYRRELLIGNILADGVPVLSQGDGGALYLAGTLPMARPTMGMAFGILTPGGYPSLFMGHWSLLGLPAAYPALMTTHGGTRLRRADANWGTTAGSVNQLFNFSPAFVDVRNQGEVQDLLIASDFGTSQVLQNEGGMRFADRTDRDVITDENGMGSAVADFDNDGKLDWFVTSVFDPTGRARSNWGVTGNRLYRNVSSDDEIAFEDVTEQAGVRDGMWGWGACAADFDNDGHLDIFHVNGFGFIPPGVARVGDEGVARAYAALTGQFQQTAPRLFMNQGDGTFVERAAQWGIDVPSEGRGITCFDYDRDGDVDISLVDHSTGLQFFENDLGAAQGSRFLDVRVVGATPNTEALGARVVVEANVKLGQPQESMLRVVSANSNFNSQNLPNLHFGLGHADIATRVTVTWLGDDEPLVCHDVPANQFLVFDQRDKTCP